jgi:hypothetical protein
MACYYGPVIRALPLARSSSSETGAEVALLAAILACIVVGVVTLKESYD